MQNMFREHKKAQTDENTETTNNKVTHICRKVIQNCGFERSREVSGLQTWNWALTPDTTPPPMAPETLPVLANERLQTHPKTET